MENHGASYDTRFKLMRERMLAMKALWTQEEAEYPRRVRELRSGVAYPKPKQRPHPPILLGGETDHTLKRIVEFCDGWFPRPRGGWEPKSAVERLRAWRPKPRGAIPSRCRSPCSARRPTRRRWRPTRCRHRQRAVRHARSQPRRDPARARQARAARQGLRRAAMGVAVGLGLMEFPFAERAATGAGSICARRAASTRSGRPTASSAASRSSNA